MAVSVVLDRAQRAALRRELDVRNGSYGDWSFYLADRDRAGCVRHLESMKQAIAVLDLIGWQESSEAPELMSMVSDDSLASWAATAADELAEALPEAGIPVDPDADLDALSALRSIAGTVATAQGEWSRGPGRCGAAARRSGA